MPPCLYYFHELAFSPDQAVEQTEAFSAIPASGGPFSWQPDWAGLNAGHHPARPDPRASLWREEEEKCTLWGSPSGPRAGATCWPELGLRALFHRI